MSVTNALVAINALNELMRTALAISSLLREAHERGQSIGKAELQAIVAERNAAIAELDQMIAQMPD